MVITMKNPFTAIKNSFGEIPIHRRLKYSVVSVIALIALIAVTVVAAIDINKEKVIDTSDPIESYDNINVIPVVFDDETTAVTENESTFVEVE